VPVLSRPVRRDPYHNVDKALLCGGRAAPAFGGGEVLAPVEVYLCGRAVDSVEGHAVPIAEMLMEGSRAWFRQNLHALDAERHVRLHNLVRPGSASLSQLFARSEGGVPPANDTSFGVGYAPLSPLERLVLGTNALLSSLRREAQYVACGEDTKVMALRQGDRVSLTIACAMIGRHLAGIEAYVAQTRAIRDRVRELKLRLQ
jgi:S-adenosylmethionine synthetase